MAAALVPDGDFTLVISPGLFHFTLDQSFFGFALGDFFKG
jgi:hypothetical protein